MWAAYTGCTPILCPAVPACLPHSLTWPGAHLTLSGQGGGLDGLTISWPGSLLDLWKALLMKLKLGLPVTPELCRGLLPTPIWGHVWEAVDWGAWEFCTSTHSPWKLSRY